MDKRNKRGDAAVDEILEELRSGNKPLPKADDQALDDILAELGMGKKTAATYTMPVKKPAPAPVQVQEAPQPKPNLQEENLRQETEIKRALPKMQAEKTEAPAKKSKKKNGDTRPSIWDIEVAEEKEPAPPRMGKAAALAKVKTDKYVGDRELTSWFTAVQAPLNKKEQRQLDKQRKKEFAAQKKEEKSRRKAGYEDEKEQPLEEQSAIENFAAFAPEEELEQEKFMSKNLQDESMPESANPATKKKIETVASQFFAAISEEIELPKPIMPEQEENIDTKRFDIEEEAAVKVPTAAYTQEFKAGNESKKEEAKSLYVDEMVDDRFREFFGETVMVDREELEAERAPRPRSKKSRNALLTGEFGKLAEQAEQAELDEDEMEDYSRPQDAAGIERDLVSLRGTLLRRTIFTSIVAVLMIWLGLAFANIVSLPAVVSAAENPTTFTLVYAGLVIVAIAINFTTVSSGLAGLFGAPTVDSPAALAAVGALLQSVVLTVQLITAQNAAPSPEATPPEIITLFGGVVALLFVMNTVGKRMRAKTILANFKIASAGINHSAAYALDNSHELAYSITKGLEEEDPTLLISRPTALVKGFLRQSFSPRRSDENGKIMGWVLLVASIVAAVVAYIISKNLLTSITTLAAVQCIGAPMSSTLVSAVPTSILQKSTARVGAVVPGWSAIEDLGQINVVMAGARDIFPPSSVRLCGIKTFEKERVDLAILYAASVLIEGCDTMRDIFLGVIQGKNDMLYKVESLMADQGRGFTAWVENSRVVIGSREMLQKHDIDPPPIEIEMKFVKEGCMPVYLAVGGKLIAMFIVGYSANPEVQGTLDSLVRSGVSLLVTSEDMNVTNELIEMAYGLPQGVVKVLGRRECELMEPLTAYLPESEGVMTHMGTFSSFIGGMRAAAACAASERMSGIVQTAACILALLLCAMLMYSGGLVGLSIGIILLYHLVWTALSSVLPLFRKG